MLPWTGGIEGTENGALVLALVSAFLYLARPAGASSVKWAVVKTIPVALFAFIAFRLDAPWLLVAGLALSALGDWFLAFEGETSFLGGLAAFFVAHVAYVALIVSQANGALIAGDLIRMALALGLALHAVVFGRILVLSVPAALKLPVAGYIAVISLMGLAAVTFGTWLLIAGALLFALSDTLLGTRNFLVADGDPRRRALDAGVWMTYVIAQALILFSFTA